MHIGIGKRKTKQLREVRLRTSLQNCLRKYKNYIYMCFWYLSLSYSSLALLVLGLSISNVPCKPFQLP